jgi:alpha-1,4-galacturonosyltransferase
MHTSECFPENVIHFVMLLKPLEFVFNMLWQNAVTTGTDEITKHKRSAFEESEKCELRFGGYCHWCDEHRESMKDFMVNKLKDQLFVARAYYPTIAKLLSQEKLTNEMRQNIQELERILSESSTDADLPPQ